MINNNALRIHVINVGHGDSILVEFPDNVVQGVRRPRFGLVDAGGEDTEVRNKTRNYLQSFIRYRLEGPPPNDVNDSAYLFEFICLTHPHADHLHGMMSVLGYFFSAEVPRAMRPKEFWDCGFRYNSARYLQILQYLSENNEDIQFMRISSGTEFHYDDAAILALAPSVDMRNRYDTYGVKVNNASIVLKITHGRGAAILTGDAEFDTWGKICEEFPRTRHLFYPLENDGDMDMRDPNHEDIAFLNQENQLDCHLLKVAHHGSKRGTSYEYIEKLSPTEFVISCDRNSEYQSTWRNKFPHALTRLIIGEETDEYNAASTQIPGVNNLEQDTATTARFGTLIYRITRGGQVYRYSLGDDKHDNVSEADLANAL